jgi:hypothetical protein
MWRNPSVQLQASRDFAGTNSGKLYAGSAGEAALGTAEKGFEQSGWKTCPMVTPVGCALGQIKYAANGCWWREWRLE